MELKGNQLFPVFLKLNQLQTVIIGAGPVGLEKLSAVLAQSEHAKITIIAEDICAEVAELASRLPQLKLYQKTYAATDLEEADIVIAATNNNILNAEIIKDAHALKLLVNVADKPDLCDFYLGSIVKKGDLKIAISTNGKSPTIAKRLKELFNESLPEELTITLDQMSRFRNTLEGDFSSKVKKLNEVSAVLVESQSNAIPVTMIETATNKKPLPKFKWLIWLTIVLSLAILVAVFWQREPEFQTFVAEINPVFYWFLFGGFVFAMVDGAIGMSYGVTSTAFSLSMGIPPASASMGVHLSEVLSNGIAGWMHYRMGNINWKLFKLLIIPGILGAVTGAWLLSSLEHYSMYTKPLVSLYTLILGWVILKKALTKTSSHKNGKIRKIGLLGLGGGFVDAVGGGGWGSIVLSSLIAGGRNARFSLGTVKLTRFFIALMSSLTFITMLKSAHWEAVAGLVIGSALAAPIAAKVSNRISAKSIMLSVGIIVILVSIRSVILFILKFI
ncbi:TSUP family transporter [Pedobacter sp. MR2016-24]|uniref:TSUP family transporter n=1 Tax=Pedobacter sp. MR2016-24 TaxID=2994466 RepID=UPI0022456347|nr:TSUP family transporter [Pedobacter sp. MR2016-24]MCX2486620.1 TSUP family transporter [Pedobacter sp. MR2016-24]